MAAKKLQKYDQWTLSRVQRVTSLASTPCWLQVVGGYDDDDEATRRHEGRIGRRTDHGPDSRWKDEEF